MGIPLKIRIRRFFKEVKCPHLEYLRELKNCGFQEFIVCECKKCGKVWVE